MKSVTQIGNDGLARLFGSAKYPANEGCKTINVSISALPPNIDRVIHSIRFVKGESPFTIQRTLFWACSFEEGVQLVTPLSVCYLKDALRELGRKSITHLVRTDYVCERHDDTVRVVSVSHEISRLTESQMTAVELAI